MRPACQPAQKKVKRIFEAEGCHIGASAKHDTWEDKNGSFESVDAFLSSDNSAGSVRDQLDRIFDIRGNSRS